MSTEDNKAIVRRITWGQKRRTLGKLGCFGSGATTRPDPCARASQWSASTTHRKGEELSGM